MREAVLITLFVALLLVAYSFIGEYGGLIKRGLNSVAKRYGLREDAAIFTPDDRPKRRSSFWSAAVASVAILVTVGLTTFQQSSTWMESPATSGDVLAEDGQVTGPISDIDLEEKTFTIGGKVFAFGPKTTVGPTLEELKRGDRVTVYYEYSPEDEKRPDDNAKNTVTLVRIDE